MSTGDEGFTASSAQGSWMEDGSKGLDAAGNLACAAIDFATVHLCAHRMQFLITAPTLLCMFSTSACLVKGLCKCGCYML